MGGKTGTTTSSVAIPPEVLARYNDVNKQAQATAGTPFQQYSTDPNAFVAPLNQQQNAGIGGINQYANAAQPAYDAAMQGTAQAYQGYNAPNYQSGVAGYMNPFVNQAMGSTAAYLQNQNQQQQQQLLGQGISAGAFGGDRGKVAQAALMGQQNLAMGNTLSNMANTGYQQSAQNYLAGLGQQGALAGQMGALGAGAQTAGLQGAQAQLGAGTLGQQTTQAGQSALYNQFQQQQAYPFQVSQFLANIAEGTGALSGSTTTQTAPQSFFSDARLKEDIKRVGTAHNGLPIYTFKYKGDDTEQTHIGYMAQDVEKVHPEAVGESHGFKTVDYDKASEPAHKYAGGVVGNSEGGAVMPQHMGQGFAVGGDVVSPTDLSALLAQQQQSYAPFQQAGIYGGQSGGTPHGGAAGVVPAGNLHVSHLQPAQISGNSEDNGLMSEMQRAENIGDRLTKMQNYAKNFVGQPARVARAATGNTPAQEAQPATGVQGVAEWAKQFFPQGQAHGGVVGYASGGGVSPYETDDPMSQVVSDTEKDKNQHGLMTAQNPTGQPSSTFGDISKIVNAGETAAAIGSGISSALPFILAPIGLATGGRAGFDKGGDTTPDDIMGKYAPAIANIESSGNYAALGPVTKTGDQAFGKYQVMGANVPSWTKEATGKEMTPDEFLSNPEAQDATFKYHFGKALSQYGNPQDAASVWFSGKPQAAAGNASDINGTTVPSYLKKFNESIGNADMPAENAAPAQAAGNGQQGFQVPEGDQQQPSALKGIGDALSGNENLIIPLLSGIGAMAGSKSRYLGSAILEGIGAGANAYENVQGNIANRGLTGAQTSQQQAITRGEDISNLQKSLQQTPTGNILWLSDGTPMEASEYIRRQKAGEKLPKVIGMAGNKMVNPEVGQATTDGTKTALPVLTPPVEQPTYGYSDISKKYAQNEPSTALEGGIQSNNLLKQGETYRQMVTANALDAKENAQSIAAGAANLAAVAGDKSLLGQSGAAYDTRSQIASIGNTVARMLTGENNYFGHGETQAQIATKIDRLRAAASASQDGQRALGAISLLESANANASQNPDAFGELEAKMLTQNQRSIDQARHLDKYGRESGQRYSNASTAFEAEMPVAQYQREAAALKEFMLSSPKAFSDAMNGKYTPAELNENFQRIGLKNMSRYFTGGEQ